MQYPPEIRWTNDVTELWRPDAIFNLWPSSSMTENAKFNAISRVLLLSTGIAYTMTGSVRDAMTGVGTLIGYVIYDSTRTCIKEKFYGKEMLESTPTTTIEPNTGGAAPLGAAFNRYVDDVGVASDSDLVAIEEARPKEDVVLPRVSETIATPQGVVQIQAGPVGSASIGIGSYSAKANLSNYLSAGKDETFPGEKTIEDRLRTESRSIRGRTSIIPTPADIHNAYRPVPPKAETGGDIDYMGGLVGRYKRSGRTV
jgi:hypothetical protein